jgi:outer membrane receptor protein involved in Fe transport
LASGLQLSGGVKNLSNTFYRDPIGLTPAVDSMIGAGRTYYVNLTWNSEEATRALRKNNRFSSSSR